MYIYLLLNDNLCGPLVESSLSFLNNSVNTVFAIPGQRNVDLTFRISINAPVKGPLISSLNVTISGNTFWSNPLANSIIDMTSTLEGANVKINDNIFKDLRLDTAQTYPLICVFLKNHFNEFVNNSFSNMTIDHLLRVEGAVLLKMQDI